MKKLKLGLLAGLTAITLSACSTSQSNNVVVSMKSGNITQDQFYNQLKNQNGASVLTTMITQSLLDAKYKVTDKEVEDRIKTYEKQLGIANDTDFEKFVTASGSYSNLSAFKKALKTNIQQFDAATDGVNPTQKELDDLYAKEKHQIEASHILVADQATAQTVYNKLKSGAKFSDMVAQFSTDSQSVANKGSLGWFYQGTMDADFEKAAFSLKKGDISQPVKSSMGWHIIYVQDIKDSSYNEMKQSLIEQAKAQHAKSQDVVMKNLMKEYNVVINDKNLDSQVQQTLSSSSQSSGAATSSSSSAKGTADSGSTQVGS